MNEVACERNSFSYKIDVDKYASCDLISRPSDDKHILFKCTAYISIFMIIKLCRNTGGDKVPDNFYN